VIPLDGRMLGIAMHVLVSPVDVRLTHQDLSELVGAARPVVSAELMRLRNEGLLSYTRCHFCVEDLSGLSRIVAGETEFAELSFV
jgi:Crp-like helix-turn-helix domain